MLFSESPRVLYNKNPLIEVICQLKFPTILKISTSPPVDFQESIRGKYPIYESPDAPKSLGELSNLPKESQGFSFSLQVGQPSHKFIDPDSGNFFVLQQEFLAYSQSKYERWEKFHTELLQAEESLKEQYAPAFYNRVGLRYRDFVVRSTLGLDKIGWQEVIRPEMLGLLGSNEVFEHVSQFESRVRIELPEGGTLALRHGLVKIKETNEEGYLIDSDFFTEGRVKSDELVAILTRFNRAAGNFFRWAITEKLHRALEPHPISC